MYGVVNSEYDGIEKREKFGRKKNVRDRVTPNTRDKRKNTTGKNRKKESTRIIIKKNNPQMRDRKLSSFLIIVALCPSNLRSTDLPVNFQKPPDDKFLFKPILFVFKLHGFP